MLLLGSADGVGVVVGSTEGVLESVPEFVVLGVTDALGGAVFDGVVELVSVLLTEGVLEPELVCVVVPEPVFVAEELPVVVGVLEPVFVLVWVSL